MSKMVNLKLNWIDELAFYINTNKPLKLPKCEKEVCSYLDRIFNIFIKGHDIYKEQTLLYPISSDLPFNILSNSLRSGNRYFRTIRADYVINDIVIEVKCLNKINSRFLEDISSQVKTYSRVIGINRVILIAFETDTIMFHLGRFIKTKDKLIIHREIPMIFGKEGILI